MSSLFASMTSCANLSPDDMVLKKMLYLYITHYATQAPDLVSLGAQSSSPRHTEEQACTLKQRSAFTQEGPQFAQQSCRMST